MSDNTDIILAFTNSEVLLHVNCSIASRGNL